MTSAYSFSAPIAVMLDAAEAEPDAPPDDDDDDDEQALASRAAASGSAAARAPVRVLMTFGLLVCGCAAVTARALADEHGYGNHFH
jgi:hypothetical protein